jgi:hypothetical protein
MSKPTVKKKEKRPIVTYEPVGYTPKQIFQRLQSENLFEILDLDPKYVPWMYISNVIQRVFARTLGQGPFGPVPIRCNEDGSLYVAGLGGGYTRNENKIGNAPNAYAGAIKFSAPMGRVDIFVFDNKMFFKRSRDGITWDPEIELFKDSFYSFDCTTLQFDIKNYTTGLIARYQILGWY